MGSEMCIRDSLTGERSPIWDPYAKGVLFGLSASHKRGDVIRAILEGVAYSFLDNLKIYEDDVGIKINGYCSDLTRTIPWGRISREERIVIEAINEAIENVLDKAQPGMKASEIDGIARDTLNKHGLSKYFIHGLGHGLGINVHEPPYITLGNNDVVKPGMVFTIEPGVYKPGKYGVRIEEDVLMTNKGLRVLSHRLSRIP